MADSPTGAKDEAMAPLFDLILKHVPEPTIEPGPFRMLGTLIESNPYLGRLITGRIFAGSVKANQAVRVLDREGKIVESGRVSKILAFRGIERVPIDEAEAGDIVAIAGLPNFNVADTLATPEVTVPLQAQPIDPPTLSMTFMVNDSPLAGTEGDKVQSRVIRERLLREAEGKRRAPRRRRSELGRLHRLRPRRTAARHPDRDHAPRRLRAQRFAPQGRVSPGRENRQDA